MAWKSCAKAHFLPRMGHGLGQLDVQEMGTSPKVAKGQRKAPLSDRKAVLLWLRGLDLNQRPPGYELPSVSPSAAAQCFPGLFGPEIAQNPKVVPLRSTAIFSNLGHSLGQQKKRASPKKAVHFSTTSPLRASMIRRIFRSTRSGI